MIGKMVALGFDMATLPARLTLRGTRALMAIPADFGGFMEQLRQTSGEMSREVRRIMDTVDAEMNDKAGHLSPEQKQQAAELALGAAEKHLSMAVVDVFRALWLAVSAAESMNRDRGPVTIDQKPETRAKGH